MVKNTLKSKILNFVTLPTSHYHFSQHKTLFILLTVLMGEHDKIKHSFSITDNYNTTLTADFISHTVTSHAINFDINNNCPSLYFACKF